MNLSFKRVCTWLLMLVMVLSVWTVPAHAQSGTIAAHSTLQANMEKYLSGLKLDENSMGLHAGIAIYDMTDQTYLYQHQANRSFIPASTLKLFTTITALDRLGPSYQWKTEVHVLGSMSADGAVNGNLVLKGYGDPTLTVDDLKGIAVALKQKGIKKVNGNLFVDESYFDSQRLGMGWMWDDEPYGYSAQLSGLAVEKNSVELTIAPGPAGAAVVNMQPATTMLKINNQITTVANSTERNITIDRPRGKNEMILTGTIGAQAKPYLQDVTMEDPALFVGELWKKELTAQGIAVQAQSSVKKTVVSKSSLLHTHLSKPLSEMIVELNKDSDNFYADMLLKTLGATQKGQGSFSAGSEVVSDLLQRAGVPEGYRVVDGSGLSRFTWITAEQMVTLLDFVQKQSYRDALEASLPIAGVDGTLASRMKGTIAEKKAIAKTGSMGGVNALSGYVTEFTSLPLQEIVDYMSKNSDNNYAEMVLKSIGAAKKGTGSADSGIQAVLETVQTLGSKTNFDMVDGSGLTRYNLISPRHFVSVLEGLNKQPFGTVIEESMSLAGEDGTLEHRFLDTDAEGNLRGVTGALTDVSSLSGYVRTQNGEKLAFSLIINGYTPPGMDLNELEEQIVSILAAHE